MQVPVFVAVWLLHCACATQRVVVTFDTWEQAAMKYDVYNATVVKQYGRRMVLDLGREAELPEDWMRGVFGQNVTVEQIGERRVGKECLRLCRSRWSPYH